MVLVAIFCLTFLFLFHQLFWKRRHLPPGPMPYPILGNIPILDFKNIDEHLLILKKEYGPVMTLWLPNPNVIVSDHEIMKATFIKNGEKHAERPWLTRFKTLKASLNQNFIPELSGAATWKVQRKFGLHVLKNFGVGRKLLEEIIINQAQDVCEFLKNHNQRPIDLLNIFITSTGNIIYRLLFNKTLSLDDNLIVEMHEHASQAFEFFYSFSGYLIELWEPLKCLDKFLGSNVMKRSLSSNDIVVKFLQLEIEEHRKSIDFNSEPRDFIDAFLHKQKKHGPQSGEWSDGQLMGSCYDLYGAGIEGMVTTLQMMIFYAIREPAIQAKIHQELDGVLEASEVISYSHQLKLPYFRAFLQEVQRITTILSINLQQKATEDVMIGGYMIPKGTTIIPQFQSVHMDDKVFKNPNKFDPSRFLDSENNFKNDERVTPFSVGKRACLGEGLARMQLFLFGATYFQHFKFLPEFDGHLPSPNFTTGFTKRLQSSFKVRVIERKNY